MLQTQILFTKGVVKEYHKHTQNIIWKCSLVFFETESIEKVYFKSESLEKAFPWGS
jgi:hypothetical protein